MKKLLQVERRAGAHAFRAILDGENANVHNHPEVVMPRPLNLESSDMMRDGEFFFVDARDVDEMLRVLAAANPGREVRVYDLVKSAQCPAGEMVVKTVDSSGVLPKLDEKQPKVKSGIDAMLRPAAQFQAGDFQPAWTDPRLDPRPR